jgi:DNA-directed RNA polymerase II subunit RPB9
MCPVEVGVGEKMATTSRHQPQMLFCERCENLLYPITDDDNQLRWLCRACKNVEEHNEVALVYALELKRELSDTKKLNELAMFAQDPTVPITTEKACPDCHRNRVAWFINPLEQPIEDMSIFFACTHCGRVWKGERMAKESGATQLA